MNIQELIFKIGKNSSGSSNYTYIPPLKSEIENIYYNLADQIRGANMDLCQMVVEITGDQELGKQFKELFLGSPHDFYQILSFINTFYARIDSKAENLITQEKMLRLKRIELLKVKREITKQKLDANRKSVLDSYEDNLRNKARAELIKTNKQTLVDGAKAQKEILDEEHAILESKIKAEKDKAKLNKLITSKAGTNIKSRILQFFSGKLKEHPEHTEFIEEELKRALEALDNIDF